MFEEVEDKEKYFIQPYVDGEYCLINISFVANNVKIKSFDKNGKRIKLLNPIKKQLRKSYESSKYNKYEIYLKGFLVNDAKNKTSLMIYDILLKDEYDGRIQSKRYQIRYENLVFRFLNLKCKDIRLIFSYNYTDGNLDAIIKQFIETNKLEKIVFRKNIPYKYEDNDIFIEDIWTDYSGKIIGYEDGTVIHREYNDKQEVVSETPVSCIKSFKILNDNNETVDVSIDNFIDSEKTHYYETINEWMNHECNYRQYKILNKTGFVFVNTK